MAARCVQMAFEEPRNFSIWTNNTLVILWYALVFGGTFSRGLSFRFLTIWLGSSIVNLAGEHMSVYGTLYTLEWVRDFLLLSIPFIIGVILVEVPGLLIYIRLWLFFVACGVYIFSIFLRWYLSDHRTHRYNLCTEILAHTVLPPILGSAIFTPNLIDDDFVFKICIVVDLILKCGRTVFVMKFEEPRLTNDMPRCLSWAQAVSNESFMAAFMQWDGGAVEKVK